jgi:hypothetical protein
MSERRRLPNRRASETFAIHCNGLDYIATISHFDDGRGQASGPLGVALDMLAAGEQMQ